MTRVIRSDKPNAKGYAGTLVASFDYFIAPKRAISGRKKKDKSLQSVFFGNETNLLSIKYNLPT